jgi:hypothetical protein
MKVHELIELLQDQNPDLEVHFSYNYGDYWRTEVAPVVDTVDVAMIVHSDYHEMDRVIDDDSDCGEVRRVVVLK